MVSVVTCPSCGAPLEHAVSTCPFCRVALSWPGAPVQSAAPGVPPEVVDALRAGNKIGAIKAYHVAKKCGLKEAKDFVDALEKKLGLG
jgi:ribosomal protein L7/L12